MTGPLCPISNQGSPVTLLKFQMAPNPKILTSSGSKKKEPRYACLSEAKASLSQRLWAEVSSLTLHPLHNGLSSSPSRWRCLLRVLCPVRRPVTALDCSVCLRAVKMTTDKFPTYRNDNTTAWTLQSFWTQQRAICVIWIFLSVAKEYDVVLQ